MLAATVYSLGTSRLRNIVIEENGKAPRQASYGMSDIRAEVGGHSLVCLGGSRLHNTHAGEKGMTKHTVRHIEALK